jgi:hypothetical protein
MKVQQELMRHDNVQTTMNVYGSAMLDSKRSANSKIVSLVLTQSLEQRSEKGPLARGSLMFPYRSPQGTRGNLS